MPQSAHLALYSQVVLLFRSTGVIPVSSFALVPHGSTLPPPLPGLRRLPPLLPTLRPARSARAKMSDGQAG